MKTALLKALDARASSGQPALLWWRDDDAVEPSPQLDRLLRLSQDRGIPATLAVIPKPTGAALAERLNRLEGIIVAVHGWSHRNHSPAGEKKQELGAHRPADVVLAEIAKGFAHLRGLHGARLVPVLVPPWNRIAPGVVSGLPGLGFEALSTFGPPQPAPLAVINTHVDLMDWHGTRGGRASDALLSDLIRTLDRPDPGAIGILSHHLVHDAQAWSSLETLFDMTQDHPGCRWTSLAALLPARR